MSDQKGNLPMGFLGGLFGLTPIVGSGILFALSITKIKPAHIAVSAACIFNTLLLGLSISEDSTIMISSALQVIIGISFGMSFIVNAIFCMNFFYKYSSDPFSLLYPEGRKNIVPPEKKFFNGIIGIALGVLPIASSVSCFLLSLKARNKSTAIISICYFVSILFLINKFGFESPITIPLIGSFTLFTGLLFYNYLGYKEEISASLVSTPAGNIPSPLLTQPQTEVSTINPSTSVPPPPPTGQGN